MEKKQYVEADFSDRRRVICISDMHGDMELFSALLDKVKLTERDALVIIGDFSNKGANCREMTELIYEMDKGENIYVLAGNGEKYNVDSYLNDRSWLLGYAKRWKGDIFSSWAMSLGYPQLDAENLDAACDAIDRNYGHIIEWMGALPLYLETPDTIFVHSGMREIPAEGMADAKTLLSDGEFIYSGENNTEKRVIVGHYPTANFGRGYSSCGILIDEERNIIGIDGGINVRSWGRLNALIIKGGEKGGNVSCEYAHRFPMLEAARDIFGENPVPPMQENWPDYRLALLQKGAEFALCRKEISGQIGLVKNEHIGQDADGLYYNKCSNSFFMSARKGELLALLDGDCGGYAYVMNDGGAMGFVPVGALGRVVKKNAL
ncbi:MAG: metallophosphoesterase [Christensenellales bacterium]